MWWRRRWRWTPLTMACGGDASGAWAAANFVAISTRADLKKVRWLKAADARRSPCWLAGWGEQFETCLETACWFAHWADVQASRLPMRPDGAAGGEDCKKRVQSANGGTRSGISFSEFRPARERRKRARGIRYCVAPPPFQPTIAPIAMLECEC